MRSISYNIYVAQKSYHLRRDRMDRLQQILQNNPNAFKKNADEIKDHLSNESKRMKDYHKKRAVKSANKKSGEYYS